MLGVSYFPGRNNEDDKTFVNKNDSFIDPGLEHFPKFIVLVVLSSVFSHS